MISKAFALLAVALAATATSPALSQDATPEGGAPRYSFSKVDNGFLRLDTRTGEVALCGQQIVGWACVAAPEDRAVLENEIARLRRENARLKQDILSHGLALPAGVMPGPPAAGNQEHKLRLPNDADIDRVLTFVGHMWRRLVEAIATAQNHLLHRG
jgi:hypothetical protein